MESEGLRSTGAGTSINGTTQYRFVTLRDNNVFLYTNYFSEQIVPHEEANKLKDSLVSESSFSGIIPESVRQIVGGLAGAFAIPKSAYGEDGKTPDTLFGMARRMMERVDPYEDDEHNLIDSMKHAFIEALGSNYHIDNDKQWDGSGLPNFTEGMSFVMTKPKPDLGFCLSSPLSPIRRHHNKSYVDQLPVLSVQYLGFLMKQKGLCASPRGPTHLNGAFPFLIVEGKTVVGDSLFVAQNQMAGGLAKSLGMLKQLVKNRPESEQCDNLPVVGVTFQGPLFEVWIAYREDMPSKFVEWEFATHIYPIIKHLDISNIWDCIRLLKVFQGIGYWAHSTYQPSVEQVLESFRPEFVV